jgi:hypothetical protein
MGKELEDSMGNLEEALLERELKPFMVFKGSSNTKNILNDVINKKLAFDDIHKFTAGSKVDFVESRPVEDPYSKNYLGAYNKQINQAFQVIRGLLTEALKYYELSSKAGYYISSDYVDDVRTDVWYDMGGTRVPCFSGIYFLESSEDSTTSINGVSYQTPSGTILLFEAGKKIIYGEESIKLLTFNIAPVPMLERQYPQKWIPIL